MNTKIRKLGNSHGLRAPKDILEGVRIEGGDEVEVFVEEETILIRPKTPRPKRFRLEDLVTRMPQEYSPSEEDWGPPSGKEVW